MPSCPEMPIRLDTGPCVWMPRQPFIYGDKDNMTFAVVTGTFIVFAIRLNFIFQQTNDFSEQRKK
jgi:hypothetical protein